MIKKLLILAILLAIGSPVFSQHLDTAWIRIYNGPGNSADVLNDIVADDSGNIYITGCSNGSGTGPDYATIKYYPNGDTAWLRRYNRGYSDVADAIAVDDSGNVVVTGYGYAITSYEDYLTIKYDSSGNQRWVDTYNGPGNSVDQAKAIAIDDSYNICVTGYSYGSGTGADFATIKYYPNGDTAWLRRYNGPDSSSDYAYDIAVDDSGFVYVTGSSTGDGTYGDFTTIKYTTDGDTRWLERYNGTGNSGDTPYAIAVDGSYNVYVTGYTRTSTQDDNYLTIKYYPDGDTAWVRTYDGSGSSTDIAFDIAVDNSGNVYVTGYVTGDGTYDDFATIKYDSNGDTAWVRTYDGVGDGYMDRAHALALDDSGNVYVTGMSEVEGSNRDFTTIRYNPDGTTAWIRTFEGEGSSNDAGRAIAVGHYKNPYWNVYPGGFSVGSGSSSDYTTIRYAQFKCGDVNCDGNVSISDYIYLQNYMFKQGPPLCPIPQSGDVNCSGGLGVSDLVYLSNYLFKLGPPPCDEDRDGIPDCYGF